MVQWVKNPTVAAQVAAEEQVQSLAQHSGLRICGVGHNCALDSVPAPGTSIFHGYSHKNRIDHAFPPVHFGVTFVRYMSLHMESLLCMWELFLDSILFLLSFFLPITHCL